MVRICAVRAAAVSTVNALAATRIPASRASARPGRNRSCDQASRFTAGVLRGPFPSRVALAGPCDYSGPYLATMQGALPSDNVGRDHIVTRPVAERRRDGAVALHHAVLALV